MAGWKMIVATVAVVTATAAGGLAGFSQWKAREISARFPPQGQFVPVEGGHIHLVDRKPDGAARGTVVLVHGASGNERDMRLPLAARLLSEGFRVIAVDRPGQGWSARTGGVKDASPARQALLIRRAVEKLGAGRAIVVGHSLAGALSLQLALDHADFTQAVALLAPVTHPWPGGIAGYYEASATPYAGWLLTRTAALPAGLVLLDDAVRTVFAPRKPPENYIARAGIPLTLRPAAMRANAQDVAVMHAFVSREAARYGGIGVPVTIITGDRDSIVRADIHSQGSARDIPDARLVELEGVGHSPHWAQPDVVVREIVALAERAGRTPQAAAR